MTDRSTQMPWLERKARGGARRLRAAAVRRGMPPGWARYRHVEPTTLRDHVDAMRARGLDASYEVVFPERVASNPLPENYADRDLLPDERGWWSYSMHDVPSRTSTETAIATVPDARIVACFDDRKQYHPAILSRDQKSIKLREITFRPGHADALLAARASAAEPQRFERATWILERVYDNHSHWLTAHLPKLCLLRDRGLVDDVILPERLRPSMRDSIRMMGLDPDAFRTFDPSRPVEVGRLTLLQTDRFRPEMLRPVRAAVVPPDPARPAHRRIYISRSRARFRRLANEDRIWPLLEDHGFERVHMEDLSFPEQVQLMHETAALVAPHGAGLTNMMFCREGTHVVEIACLGFPNPNFYAVAAAMGHRYHLVSAEAHGDVPPLEQDLLAEPEAIRRVLQDIASDLRPAEPGMRA